MRALPAKNERIAVSRALRLRTPLPHPGLEMVQEPSDEVGVDVVDGQVRRHAPKPVRRQVQQWAEGVALAGERVAAGAQP